VCGAFFVWEPESGQYLLYIMGALAFSLETEGTNKQTECDVIMTSSPSGESLEQRIFGFFFHFSFFIFQLLLQVSFFLSFFFLLQL